LAVSALIQGGHGADAIAFGLVNNFPGAAAAVLAGIGAAETGSKDHCTGHAAIGEAIGKAKKGRRGGHFLIVLMMV
jgi:hypothetical protein